MTPVDDLRTELRVVGVPDGFYAVWSGPALDDPRSLAHGREHTWLVAPMTDGTWLVGGSDRGRFAPYDRYESLGLCVNAVRHLFFGPADPVGLDAAAADTGARLAGRLHQQIAAGDAIGSAELPVGTALDRYGPLSGHVLFTWRTPFPQRSSPPTDLNLPYVQLVVRRPLPTPFGAGVMAPWFEQPGGGTAISLPRTVRWYFDAGYLDLFRTGSDAA